MGKGMSERGANQVDVAYSDLSKSIEKEFERAGHNLGSEVWKVFTFSAVAHGWYDVVFILALANRTKEIKT